MSDPHQELALEMTRALLAPVAKLHGALVGAETAIATDDPDSAERCLLLAQTALAEVAALAKRMEKTDA